MAFSVPLRSYLLVLGGNLLFFLWAWLGVNHGKGLFFFTTDEIGLIFLLPLAFVINLVMLLISFGMNKRQLINAFGVILLLLLSGCTAVWVHAYSTGVTS